jgi:malate synthase
MAMASGASPTIELRAEAPKGAEGIVSREALDFVAGLVRAFRPRHRELMAARVERQARVDAGGQLDFLAETASVRAGDWKVASIPADLTDRRVEITGPCDRKMIVNALNSGASVFMADLEDATAPTWENVIGGQRNLFDAVRRQIDFDEPTTGKRYALAEKTATLLVRPRGLHLPERHILVDGEIAPGFLVDFGLYFFHNARALIERGSGPYFYLPKLESHLEARLWNDVFVAAQRALGIPEGTIRATVLIETLWASFQMDEILHELRAHASGLNCGRWDYIFSFIKVFRAHADRIVPDRSVVTMEQPFMRAYTQLVIKTCHRRGAHAMGGMAAQIPIKRDPAANEAALAKVRADKLREVKDGHDGTWVAHPGLVPIAKAIFDEHMPTPNQIHRLREDVATTAEDLVRQPTGPRTEKGLRHNLKVGLQYVEAWLRGVGCVPLYDLMEDAATAEISRSQAWQWLKHGAELELEQGGSATLDQERFLQTLDAEVRAVADELGADRFASGRFAEARAILADLVTQPQLESFLTLPAYERLVASLAPAAGGDAGAKGGA